MTAALLSADSVPAPEEPGRSGSPSDLDRRVGALGGTSLNLLGGWALERNGAPVAATTSEQRLVVLLALQGRQRRPYVAGTLWSDVEEKQALRRLRNTLWSLRRRCPRLLETSEDAVALEPSVAVDVRALESAAQTLLQGRNPGEPLESHLALLARPVELLPGWYEDWVLQERDRIDELRIRALEALIDPLVARGLHGAASVAAVAAIQLDPLRESSHRALMRVYLAEGNPALAARQVERYRRILRRELGLAEPTAEMLALVAAIQTSTRRAVFPPATRKPTASRGAAERRAATKPVAEGSAAARPERRRGLPRPGRASGRRGFPS